MQRIFLDMYWSTDLMWERSRKVVCGTGTLKSVRRNLMWIKGEIFMFGGFDYLTGMIWRIWAKRNDGKH